MSDQTDMTKNAMSFDPAKFTALEPVLRAAQRIGALSGAPIEQIIGHALWFAKAIPREAKRVIDLGSGAGVPGLIVAFDRPELELVLVDRRSGRTDTLTRSVMALNIGGRVSVKCSEISDLVQDNKFFKQFDAAISRGLGPPVETLKLSRDLVKPGGVVIISEPPPSAQSRWNPEDVLSLGLNGPIRHGAVAMFHVKQSD
ncbi:MAG: RsmG family class I SAM-dependent methyltransferase [Acidimicrobiaceae bacterium]